MVSAFCSGTLALGLLAPRLPEAQEARGRAESVLIVGGGTDRFRLGTKHEGQASDLSLLGPDGTTGSPSAPAASTSPCANASGMNIYAEDGRTAARLGTWSGPAC